MSAAALRYQPRLDRNVELREQILTLAQRYKRYGVGMIASSSDKRGARELQARGTAISGGVAAGKALEAEEGARGCAQPLLRPTAVNQVWSMDFVSDRTAEGRVLTCLTIVDDATHEAVAIEVERAISGRCLRGSWTGSR